MTEWLGVVNEAKETLMEQISGADLLGMRSHAKEAENYVLQCSAYIDRMTRAYLALQIENVRLREDSELLAWVIDHPETCAECLLQI